MGYTQYTVNKLDDLIARFQPKRVMDLGAQNLYNQPKLPAPYASEYYEAKGISYDCIDLSGENGAWPIDLATDTLDQIDWYDMLVDAGTSEHVGIKGRFDWRAIYNCWALKLSLVKVGGIIYSENPKTGNWPGHGFNYYTKSFYVELSQLAGVELLDVGENAAMNNYTDGWNVYATLKKVSEDFISLEKFQTLALKRK